MNQDRIAVKLLGIKNVRDGCRFLSKKYGCSQTNVLWFSYKVISYMPSLGEIFLLEVGTLYELYRAVKKQGNIINNFDEICLVLSFTGCPRYY